MDTPAISIRALRKSYGRHEALKGIVKSVYWKPTLIWIVEKVRVLHPFRTQTKGVKPIKPTTGGNDLSIYTYLANVAYQVKARFIWNEHRPELEQDRIEGKHYEIARRMLARGGRQDIFWARVIARAMWNPAHLAKARARMTTWKSCHSD